MLDEVLNFAFSFFAPAGCSDHQAIQSHDIYFSLSVLPRFLQACASFHHLIVGGQSFQQVAQLHMHRPNAATEIRTKSELASGANSKTVSSSAAVLETKVRALETAPGTSTNIPAAGPAPASHTIPVPVRTAPVAHTAAHTEGAELRRRRSADRNGSSIPHAANPGQNYTVTGSSSSALPYFATFFAIIIAILLARKFLRRIGLSVF